MIQNLIKAVCSDLSWIKKKKKTNSSKKLSLNFRNKDILSAPEKN